MSDKNGILKIEFDADTKQLERNLIASIENVGSEIEQELTQKLENAFESAGRNPKLKKQLTGVYQSLFDEMSSASGDINKTSRAIQNFIDKLDFLRRLEARTQANIFDNFDVGQIDKVLEYFNEIEKRKKELDILAKNSEQYRIDVKAETTVKDLKDITSSIKLTEKESKKYVELISNEFKKNNINTEPLQKAIKQYAELLSLYEKINAKKVEPKSKESVIKQQQLAFTMEQIQNFENSAIPVVKNILGNFRHSIAETAPELQKTLNEILVHGVEYSITQYIKVAQQKLNAEITALRKQADQYALETAQTAYEKNEKNFEKFKQKNGDVKKKNINTKGSNNSSDTENINEINDALSKYIVSLEEAKQKALEFSKTRNAQSSVIDKNNIEDIKNMIAYTQRYIDLGGKLEDIGLDRTSIRRFQGNANFGEYTDEINQLKISISSIVSENGEISSTEDTVTTSVNNNTVATENNTNVINDRIQTLQEYLKMLQEIEKQEGRMSNEHIATFDENGNIIDNAVGSERNSSLKLNRNARTVVHSHPFNSEWDNLRFDDKDFESIFEGIANTKLRESITYCGNELLKVDVSNIDKSNLEKLNYQLNMGIWAVMHKLGNVDVKELSKGKLVLKETDLSKLGSDFQNEYTRLVNGLTKQIIEDFGGTVERLKINKNGTTSNVDIGLNDLESDELGSYHATLTGGMFSLLEVLRGQYEDLYNNVEQLKDIFRDFGKTYDDKELASFIDSLNEAGLTTENLIDKMGQIREFASLGLNLYEVRDELLGLQTPPDGDVHYGYDESGTNTTVEDLENLKGRINDVENQIEELQNKFSTLDNTDAIKNLTEDIITLREQIGLLRDELSLKGSDQGDWILEVENRVDSLTERLEEVSKVATDASEKLYSSSAVQTDILSGSQSDTTAPSQAERINQISKDTVEILSNENKTEAEIVQQIRDEIKAAEELNEVTREHLILLDKEGKVVSDHRGSQSNVRADFTEEQLARAKGGKLLHVHPGDASFFGLTDQKNLFQNQLYSQLEKIELLWGDSTLSVNRQELTDQKASIINNIMRNVRQTLTEMYNDNANGAPSADVRHRINAIEKEIFKSITDKLCVTVTEEGTKAQEVTAALSDIDKAIIQRFKNVEQKVVQDINVPELIKGNQNPNLSGTTAPLVEGQKEYQEELAKTKGKVKETAEFIAETFRGVREESAIGEESLNGDGTFRALDYATGRSYGKYVEKTKVSISNPLWIDANNQQWDNIQILGDGLDENSARAIELANNLIFVFNEIKDIVAISDDLDPLNMKTPFSVIGSIGAQIGRETDEEKIKKLQELREAYLAADDAYQEFSNDTSHPYGRYTTNSLIKQANAMGHNGLVIDNVFDKGANGIASETSTVVVNFMQEQCEYIEKIVDEYGEIITESLSHLNKSKSNQNSILSDGKNEIFDENALNTDIEKFNEIANIIKQISDNIAIINGDEPFGYSDSTIEQLEKLKIMLSELQSNSGQNTSYSELASDIDYVIEEYKEYIRLMDDFGKQGRILSDAESFENRSLKDKIALIEQMTKNSQKGKQVLSDFSNSIKDITVVDTEGNNITPFKDWISDAKDAKEILEFIRSNLDKIATIKFNPVSTDYSSITEWQENNVAGNLGRMYSLPIFGSEGEIDTRFAEEFALHVKAILEKYIQIDPQKVFEKLNSEESGLYNIFNIIGGGDSGIYYELVERLQTIIDKKNEAMQQLVQIPVLSDSITTTPVIEQQNELQEELKETSNRVHLLTDEYGNLMKLYRGVRNTIGTGLSSDRYHGGTFWTDNIELAKEYSEYTKLESGNISMFNPFEIEGNGTTWNNIENLGRGIDDASKSIIKAKKELQSIQPQLSEIGIDIEKINLSGDDSLKRFSSIDDVIEIISNHIKSIPEFEGFNSDLKSYDEVVRGWESVLAIFERASNQYRSIAQDSTNMYGKFDTNRFVELAKANGFDGVIFKNIIDSYSGAVKDISNVIVTFNNEQLHNIETIAVDPIERKLFEIRQTYGDISKYSNVSVEEISNALKKLSEISNEIDEIERENGYNYESYSAEIKNRLSELGSEYSSIVNSIEEIRGFKNIHPNLRLGSFDSVKNADGDWGEDGLFAIAAEEILTHAENGKKAYEELTQSSNNSVAIQTDNANIEISNIDKKTEAIEKFTNAYKEYLIAQDNYVIDHNDSVFSNDGNPTQSLIDTENKIMALEKEFPELKNYFSTLFSGIGEDETFSKLLQSYLDRVLEIKSEVSTFSKPNQIPLLFEESNGQLSFIEQEIQAEQHLEEQVKATNNVLENQPSSIPGQISMDDYLGDLEKQKQEIIEVVEAEEKLSEVRRESFNLPSVQDDNIQRLKESEYEVIEANERLSDSAKETYQWVENEGNSASSAADKMIELYDAKARAVEANLKLKESAEDTANYLALEGNSAEKSSKKVDKFKRNLKNDFNEFNKKYEKLSKQKNLDKYQNEYSDIIKRIKDKMDEVSSFGDIELLNDEQITQVQKAKAEISDLFAQLENIGEKGNGARATSLAARMQQFASTLHKSNPVAKEYRQRVNELVNELLSIPSKDRIAEIAKEFGEIEVSAKRAGVEGKNFADMFKDQLLHRTMQQLATYFSFNDILGYFGQGIEYVKELNTAITELQLVTNKSGAELDEFTKKAKNVATEVGSTTTEIVKSSTEWARLGYSIDDSLTLATQSAKLATTGFMEVGDATTYMTSAIQAFYGSDISKGIMNVEKASTLITDKFVKIGNNFAITAADLGSGLTRSAAALVAANNDIDETIALTTAGNTILQDADTVSKIIAQVYGNIHKENSYIG